jgi:molecular chaperone GrpE
MEGVVLIQRQLLEELSREGLHPMDSVGSAFDPEMHEAVATDAASGTAPNTVTAVLQRGYFFHDRVLRAALVRVSVDGGASAAEPPEREES